MAYRRACARARRMPGATALFTIQLERRRHARAAGRTATRRGLIVCAAVSLALLAGGCNSAAGPVSTGGPVRVVAGENFWGSIAAQLGGAKVAVQSIIVNPDTDPHSYEPTAADARAVAGARMAIVNGIGYDEWMPRLLDASPSAGRLELTVGTVLGLGRGENPHQWYSPTSVQRVIAAIVADYVRLEPRARSYFEARERLFESRDLAAYKRLLAAIRARYAGVPVGYSESIFAPLGRYLGLDLRTPSSFAKAVAEGTEVSARDTETVEEQAREHRISVWVYNSQNATPEVQRVTALARRAHIPVVTVTETLAPASASFEQWQRAELERLQSAFHEATGR